MKKSIFILLFMSFFFVKEANAFIMGYDTSFGYYVDNIHYDFYMYVDMETNKPVFRINYEEERAEEWLIEETNDIGLTDEELKQIVDYIFYVTDGKNHGDLTTRELIGTQAFIWKMYQEKSGIPMRWNCDVGYLVDYEKIIVEKKKEFETPVEMFYEAVVNEPLTIQILPYLKTKYSLVPETKDYQVETLESSIVFTPLEEKEYTLELDSERSTTEIKFFKGENSTFIELIKMGEPKPILHVNATYPSYSLKVIESEGIHVSLPDKGKVGEEIKVSYQLEEGYALDKVELITKDGVEEIKEDAFLMPDEEVTVRFLTRKNVFSIKTIESEGIHVSLPDKGKVGEEIKVSYQLEEGYALEKIELITKNGVEEIKEDVFLMPDEEITVRFLTKKTTHKLTIITDDGLTITTAKKEYKEKEKVTFETILEEDYTLDYIMMNQQVLENNEFVMPSVDVYLYGKTIKKEKEYQIQVSHNADVTLSIPSSSVAGEVVTFSYETTNDKTVEQIVLQVNTEYYVLNDLSFIMPKGDVTIHVFTTEKQNEPVTVYPVPNTKDVSNAKLWFWILAAIVYAKKCQKSVKFIKNCRK